VSGAPPARALGWNLERIGELDPGVPLGEGMALQWCADGRRVLWVPMGAAPARALAIDVTDPAQPAAVGTLALPSRATCTCASVAGDVLALAVAGAAPGATDVGVFVCDVRDPSAPRVIGRFGVDAPHGRGAMHVWFSDAATLHVAASAPDCVPRDARDDTVYQRLDLADPARPQRAGQWWLPGTMTSDDAAPPRRVDSRFDTGVRLHAARAWPDRPDRVWLAYGDGGLVVLDGADPERPRPVLRRAHSPPYHGATHAAVALGRRGYALVADAAVADAGADAPKLVWVVDARADSPERAAAAGPSAPPRNALAVGSLAPPPAAAFAPRGGRFGAHAVHANPPGRGVLATDTLAITTCGNAGVRVHDVTDPYATAEVAYHVPAGTGGQPTQLHDVLADDRGIVFAVERLAGGLAVLALDL
jgi:hypothetical protein